MKTAQLLLGLGAGVATGIGVALMNRDKKIQTNLRQKRADLRVLNLNLIKKSTL